MAAEVRITEYTDPGCPWAWSAEPFRRRLQWLYGDSIEWRERMVGLSESPEHYEEKGFTTEKQASAFAKMADKHGMPIDTSERPRMAATLPACLAVVAAQLNAPERARQLLRCLRVQHFSGALLDERETIDSAAAQAELDPGELARWMEQDDTERVLREEMDAARQPIAAARALDEKLAGWSGGRRYTCPSYEIERLADGIRIAVPGFQPFPVYDVILANLVPGQERRDSEPGVVEVLQWAGTPLATREVAELTQLSDREAREELGRVAIERHLGSDGLWKLSPAAAA